MKKYWVVYFFMGTYHWTGCNSIEEVNKWIEVFEEDADDPIPYTVEEIYGGRGRLILDKSTPAALFDF